MAQNSGERRKRQSPPYYLSGTSKRPLASWTEFFWVDGYWYPVANDYRWHSGYWTRPPYPAARWVVPRHDGERFFVGYWEGDHGRFEHNHHRDHDRDRDFR